MPQVALVKKLTEAGITATSDGLLRDFIGRGKFTAAEDALLKAIARREAELIFLKDLQHILKVWNNNKEVSNEACQTII
jgi:hypothetical protein